MTDLPRIRVRPARPDLRIRMPNDPATLLPAEGASVPGNTFWHRLLRDGDVVIDLGVEGED